MKLAVNWNMSLLQMSFAGALLILAIVIVRVVTVNRLPKRSFVFLWGIALLRLLLPISVPFRFSVYSMLSKYMRVDLVHDSTPVIFVFSVPQEIAEQSAVKEAAMGRPDGWGFILSLWGVIWCIGVLCCAVFFLSAWLRSHREFGSSLPVDNQFVADWLVEHPLLRHVTVRQSDRISAPLTYGILRPVILMPRGTDWNDRERLQYILLHEYLHIRHMDASAKLIATAALCIHWFNPFVWLLCFLFHRDIELACDESVVRRFGEDARSAYARMLITMEEQKSGLMPLCNNFSKNAIEGRITAIMKFKKLTLGVILVSIMVVVAVVLVFATSARVRGEMSNRDAVWLEEPSKVDSYQNTVKHYYRNEGYTTEEDIVGEYTDVETDNLATWIPNKEINGQEEAEEILVNLPMEAVGAMEVAQEFARAYFDGDEDALRSYLIGDFDSIYEGGEEINILDSRFVAYFVGDENIIASSRFISEVDPADACVISIGFLEGGEDSRTYLTLSMVSQGDEWKVDWYGLGK